MGWGATWTTRGLIAFLVGLSALTRYGADVVFFCGVALLAVLKDARQRVAFRGAFR